MTAKSDTATDIESVKSAMRNEQLNNTTSHPDNTNEKYEVAAATDDENGSELERVATEYPAKWRLFLISVALCLSVFCMALVSDLWLQIATNSIGNLQY